MQKIVTHAGSFDPDDVLAVAVVQLYLGVSKVQIIRTRDEKIIAEADWLIDVGGKYDVTTNRFDHHQNGVPDRENGIPYSSFGLVWKEYGAQICGSALVADNIEKRLAFPIDTADNQVAVCLPKNPAVEPFEFFDVVSIFKPVWGSDETFDQGFIKAVDFARVLLQRMIRHEKGQLEIHKLIQDKYTETSNKAVLVFDEPLPRGEFLRYTEVQVVVTPVFAEKSTNWMAAVVPEDDHVFRNRVLFPETWAGLTDAGLVLATGIDGAVFCHKERYVFVAKSKTAALQAATQVCSQTMVT